jgi:hypothetical protein
MQREGGEGTLAREWGRGKTMRKRDARREERRPRRRGGPWTGEGAMMERGSHEDEKRP